MQMHDSTIQPKTNNSMSWDDNFCFSFKMIILTFFPSRLLYICRNNFVMFDCFYKILEENTNLLLKQNKKGLYQCAKLHDLDGGCDCCYEEEKKIRS